MGACDFSVIIYGRSAEEAFHKGRELEAYEHGHGGYTGTMAEKEDFVMIDDTWKTLKERYAKAVKELNEVIAWLNERSASNFNADELERRLSDLDIPMYVQDRRKSPALNHLRKEAKSLREKRNSCKPNMTAEDIANRLLFDFCDKRVDDKWGPAGCIDMDPKLSGKRKDKRFLFFGLASS